MKGKRVCKVERFKGDPQGQLGEIAVTAEALWGESQANRRVYIEIQKNRGFRLPRLRESRDFSPSQLNPNQHIDEPAQ